MRPATIFDYLPIGIWLTPQQAVEVYQEARDAMAFFELLMSAHPGSLAVH